MINWLLDLFAAKYWTVHITKDGQPVMRRRVKGGWEYRPMTVEDHLFEIDRQIW